MQRVSTIGRGYFELQAIAVLKDLPDEHLRQLAAVMIRRTYAPGQIIFLEGDSASGIWFVAQGRVRIIKQSLSGRTQGLCLVNQGKCFGGCPLFDGEVNPANAQAVDDVVLWIFPRDRLYDLIQDNAVLAGTILDVLSSRLAHLARLGEGLGAWTAASRINDCLVSYADSTKPVPIVRLTHEKIAVLAGTAREVVTRHLSDLEKESIVRLEPGQIVLLDSSRLTRLLCEN